MSCKIHMGHRECEKALTSVVSDEMEYGPNYNEKSQKSTELLKGIERRPSLKRRESTTASTSPCTWSGSQALPFQSQKQDVSLNGRITVPLVIAASVTILGSSFPHGWGTGVLNTPQELIKNFLNETWNIRLGSEPEPWLVDVLWAISVSIYLLGGCGGAFVVGFLADYFGRKRAILVCHVFQYVAALLFGFCLLAKSFEMLMIARFITGFGCGAGSGLVPMFLTEIAPINYRGAMGVLHQFALTSGILASQCIGLSSVLGYDPAWPLLLAFIVIPTTVSLVVLPWYPESPRYLLVNRNLRKEAEKALQIYRGENDVSRFMKEMEEEKILQESEPKWSFGQLFRSKALRMPLFLVCALATSQQLSGINVVFYYSGDIFKRSGIPEDKIQFANIGTGVVNVLMTGISVPLMEKSGRRPLLLIGMILMTLSSIGLTIGLNLTAVAGMAYLSMACVFLFVIGFAIGLGSIPQFIGAELFKQGPRPPAMSFAGLLNWLSNFIVGVTFPSMQSALGAFSFLVFTATVVGFGLVFWRKLPETKNKSYNEIYKLLGIAENPVDLTQNQPLLIMNKEKQTLTVLNENDDFKLETSNNHSIVNRSIPIQSLDDDQL